MPETLGTDARSIIAAALDRALDKQCPVAASNVARLRRLHPEKTSGELIAYFENWYLGTVSASGVAPEVKTPGPDRPVRIPSELGDFLAYLTSSVLFILEVAEIQGLVPADHERRRLLVLAALLGEADATALEPIIGPVGPLWGARIVDEIPMTAVDAANQALRSRITMAWRAGGGAPVPGTHSPLMVEARVAGDGDGLTGWRAVTSVRRILGPDGDSRGC